MGIVSCVEHGQGDRGTGNGRRRFARTADASTIEALLTGDPIGVRARLGNDGGFDFV